MDVKRIVAAIRPFKLEAVREALTALGVRGMMISEMNGLGEQQGHTETYRGTEHNLDFVPRLKLELVVPDALAGSAVEAIRQAAHTGETGDGKIFVFDVVQAVRVRTGETDDDAL